MSAIFSEYMGPPAEAFTTLMAYDGSSNLEYVGLAKANQPETAWEKATAALTSIGVSSNVGTVTTAADHGLAIGQRVTVSGATADTDLNGTYIIQTVPTGTTFTITTVDVSDGTYTEATLRVSTTAPRSTLPIWAIKKLTYSGTTNTEIRWAEGSSGMNKIWDSKTSYAYN